MAKVSYKQGAKKTYLGLETHYSNALYFCTDTRELFKGDDLYTDGLRFVESYTSLPAFEKAADGKLYYAKDEQRCYVLNETRDGWIALGDEFDGITIGKNGSGLVEVKSVPIGKVEGLEGRLTAIEQAAVGGVHYKGSVATFEELPADAKQGDLYEVSADNSEWCYNGKQWFEYGKTTELSPVATAELGEEFSIAEDNKLRLTSVSSDKVFYRGESLTDAVDRLAMALMWEDMGENIAPDNGGVAELVSNAEDGATVNFSSGSVVETITVSKSAVLKGSTAGLAQNFKQEV